MKQCAAQATGKRCPPVKGRESETCVCQSDKGIIDLSSLSSTTDGTPRSVKIHIIYSYQMYIPRNL